jgi:hypothetical protein
MDSDPGQCIWCGADNAVWSGNAKAVCVLCGRPNGDWRAEPLLRDHAVVCMSCTAGGPLRATEAEAVAVYREMADRLGGATDGEHRA